LCPHRVQWQKASETLGNNGILSQLEIAVVRHLGVIGIVFLTGVFFQYSKLQKRHEPYSARVRARLVFFRLVYWTLAISRL